MTISAEVLFGDEAYLSERQSRLLEALTAAGTRGMTTRQLIAAGGGTEATRRVRELRAAGYPIVAFRDAARRWRYALI